MLISLFEEVVNIEQLILIVIK